MATYVLVQCFEQPLNLPNEQAVGSIPQFHIVSTSTLSTRDPELMKDARDRGRLWDIDTGHDLMITEPDRWPRRCSRWLWSGWSRSE